MVVMGALPATLSAGVDFGFKLLLCPWGVV